MKSINNIKYDKYVIIKIKIYIVNARVTLFVKRNPSTRHYQITKPDFLPCLMGGSSLPPLHSWANLRLARINLCMLPLPFGRPMPHKNCLTEIVP